MGYCKADDAQICQECGVLIADGYQQNHARQHPHAYEARQAGEPECLYCHLFQDAAVHARRPSIVTVGMSDQAIDLEMTICEAQIDGIPVVIVPEKAQRMLRGIGWQPPSAFE